MRSARLVVFVAALGACTPEVPAPVWEGEHLHYGTTTRQPICRGSFHLQERHAVELAALLGFELPDVIHFTRVSFRQIRKYCRGRVRGCAWLDEPFAFAATSSFDFHEIAHIVASLGGLGGPDAFVEGFAEVFDDLEDPRFGGAPLVEVLGGELDSEAAYHTAGRFVRFMIERHGLATVVAFMRAAPRDAEREVFAPIFAEVFDEPLEAAIAAFAMYPQCSDTDNRIAVLDCSLPLEPWDGGALTIAAEVACERDDVLGPDAQRRMSMTRGFEIAAAGRYRLTVADAAGTSQVRIVRCGSCWDGLSVDVPAGEPVERELAAGRYYVQFARRVDEPGEVSLVIEAP